MSPYVPSLGYRRLLAAREKLKSRIVRQSQILLLELSEAGIVATASLPFAEPPQNGNLVVGRTYDYSGGEDIHAGPQDFPSLARETRSRRHRRWFRVPDSVRIRIMRAIAEGKSQTEIARRVGLSLGTVSRINKESRHAQPA